MHCFSVTTYIKLCPVSLRRNTVKFKKNKFKTQDVCYYREWILTHDKHESFYII